MFVLSEAGPPDSKHCSLALFCLVFLTGFQTWSAQPRLASGLPSIIEHPVSRTADVGTEVRFQVVAAGGPLTFQWFKNDQLISGAISDTLILSSVTVSDAAFYKVAVSNSNGTVLSLPASLAVLSPIIIKTQPANQTVKLGAASVMFKVEALSQLPLSYRWFKDGTGMNHATNNTLTITNIQRAHAGAYSAIVLNAQGNVLSDRAILTVDTQVAPIIFRQPTNQVALVGGSAEFSVEADGHTPLAFQWLVNGRQVQKGTNSSLLLTAVQPTDAGNYTVVISNRVGQITSTPALLTVNTPPSITTQPRDQTNAAGGNILLTVAAAGSTPLHYQWFKNDLPVAKATNASVSLQRVQPFDAGVYRVTVTNPFGSAISSNAMVVITEPPVFVTQPLSQIVLAGTNVTFAVDVTGRSPIFYQWLKNGAAITGATNPVLSLRSVQAADAGNYSITASNVYAQVASSAASLRVEPAVTIRTQPQSRTVTAGTNVTFTVSALGAEPLVYQWLKNGSVMPVPSSTNLLLERVSIADAANYVAVVRNAFGSATSLVAVLTVNAPPAINVQPLDQFVIANSNVKLETEVTGSPPLRIQWFKNGSILTGAVSNVLSLTNVQAVHSGRYHLVASNSFGAATSRIAQLTVHSPPRFLLHPTDQTASLGAQVQFDVRLEGTPPFTFQWFKDGQPLDNGVEQTLVLRQVQIADSGRYKLQVRNLYGTAESIEALLTVQFPPVIKSQPADQIVLVGADLAFNIDAAGRPPLQFQWFKDGQPIPGANAASLTFKAITSAAAGRYKVSVQNNDGRADSSEFRLTVENSTAPRADFDSDGQTDLVFQSQDGQIALWFMRQTDLRAAAWFEPDRVAADWEIAATGDLNRDRQEDLIFQNKNGAMAVWFMAGAKRVGGRALEVPIGQPSEWQLISAADFNQDAHLDLLVQHSTGSIAIWLLNGSTLIGNQVVSLSPGDPQWRLAAANDLDRDGHADLIFQHRDGTLAVWYLSRANVRSTTFTSPNHPGDPHWRLVNVIDRNANGSPDFLFQHQSERTLAVWLMEGHKLVDAKLIKPSNPGAGWRVVGR